MCVYIYIYRERERERDTHIILCGTSLNYVFFFKLRV